MRTVGVTSLLGASAHNYLVERLRDVLPDQWVTVVDYGHCSSFLTTMKHSADRPDLLFIGGATPDDRLHDERITMIRMIADWSERESIDGVVYSCLAAQLYGAAKLGLAVHRQPKKLFGVFRHHCEERYLYVAHSRWNAVDWHVGIPGFAPKYPRAGSGEPLLWVGRSRPQVVLMQGHPEYQTEMLAREYFRDLRHGNGQVISPPTYTSPTGSLDSLMSTPQLDVVDSDLEAAAQRLANAWLSTSRREYLHAN